MSLVEQAPLVAASRRRGWPDILLLRPPSVNPHASIVVVRHGRLVGIVPAGGGWVLSDYIDWPSEIYEVDARERRMVVDAQLESADAGHAFVAAVQLTYRVARPERVALELENPIGDLEQALLTAMRAVARTLTLDQAALLKESIEELLRPGSALAARVADLGLSLRRADVVADPHPSERAYAERLRDLQRERPFIWRLLSETRDSQIFFEVQVAGGYRAAARSLQAYTDDTLEYTLRDAVSRAVQRVAAQYTIAQFSEATKAIADALRTSPILHAELAAAEVTLIRPVVELAPARPQIANTVRALAQLPAPTSDEELDDLLPPPERLLAAPQPAQRQIAQPAPPPAERPAAQPAPPPTQTQAAPRPLVPIPVAAPPPPPILTPKPAWAPPAQPAAAQAPAPVEEPEVEEELEGEWSIGSSVGSLTPEPAAEEYGEEELDEEVGTEPAGWGFASPTAPTVAAAQAPEPEAEPEGEEDEAERVILRGSSADEPFGVELQVARWVRLLRSDGEEEFERWSQAIIEHPDRLAVILGGLIRDRGTLRHSDEHEYQRALATELANLVPPVVRPAWLAAEPPPPGSEQAVGESLPAWLRMR